MKRTLGFPFVSVSFFLAASSAQIQTLYPPTTASASWHCRDAAHGELFPGRKFLLRKPSPPLRAQPGPDTMGKQTSICSKTFPAGTTGAGAELIHGPPRVSDSILI